MKIERSEEYKSQKFIEHRKMLISRLISKALKNGAVVNRHISCRYPQLHKFFPELSQLNPNFFVTEFTISFPNDRVISYSIDILFKEDFDLIAYRKVKLRLKKEIEMIRVNACYSQLKQILHASHNGAEILNWGLHVIKLHYGFDPNQKK
jgi:hypothetical protein